MHLLCEPGEPEPAVVMCSALEETGLDRIWEIITKRQRARETSGALATRRAQQNTLWMWSLVDEHIRSMLRDDNRVGRTADEVERQVRGGALSPVRGAETILAALGVGSKT
jgi:LAO/AO transport system kinase